MTITDEPGLKTFVVDNIGMLVTNHPELGEGPLGVLRNVSLVVAGGEVVSIGATGQLADERIDARGRCVLPGFVDSHTHFVFAEPPSVDRQRLPDGGPTLSIRLHNIAEATRHSSDNELRDLTLTRLYEAHRAGTTTVEIKSGFGLTVDDEARSIRLASEATSETTFYGAHVVPPSYVNRPDEYTSLVCGAMLDAAKSNARWIDATCEPGAFDVDQCRAVLEAGRNAGLGVRLHANQHAQGHGVQLAVELGAASVDHCTHMDDRDIAALAASNTVATFLPASEFFRRGPYPNARRVLDAGARVALASGYNPTCGQTTSLSFVIALAVREMGMSIDEAIQAITTGGARALQRYDIGHLSPGAKGHLVILDSPTYHDLAYRPGVPLIAQTIGPLGERLIG